MDFIKNYKLHSMMMMNVFSLLLLETYLKLSTRYPLFNDSEEYSNIELL